MTHTTFYHIENETLRVEVSPYKAGGSPVKDGGPVFTIHAGNMAVHFNLTMEQVQQIHEATGDENDDIS